MILEVTVQLYGEEGDVILGYSHKEVVMPEPSDEGLTTIGLAMLDRADEAKSALGSQIERLRELGAGGGGES